MVHFNKKVIVALILQLVAILPFLLGYRTYQYIPPTMSILPLILFGFVVPLIVISLVLNSVSLIQEVKNNNSIVHELIVFALCLLLVVLYFIFRRTGLISINHELYIF